MHCVYKISVRAPVRKIAEGAQTILDTDKAATNANSKNIFRNKRVFSDPNPDEK
jgi:hypothetical protein